jgi:hypothetical protein
LALTLLSIGILSVSAHYQIRTNLYVIPVLIYLVGHTLSIVNTVDKFSLFLNVRFISYTITIATLVFVGMYLRRLYIKNSEAVYHYAYATTMLTAVMLFAVAITLEILDLKDLNKAFASGGETVIIVFFYTLYALILFLIGRYYELRILSLASILMSVYAVLYMLNTFLF